MGLPRWQSSQNSWGVPIWRDQKSQQWRLGNVSEPRLLSFWGGRSKVDEKRLERKATYEQPMKSQDEKKTRRKKKEDVSTINIKYRWPQNPGWVSIKPQTPPLKDKPTQHLPQVLKNQNRESNRLSKIHLLFSDFLVEYTSLCLWLWYDDGSSRGVLRDRFQLKTYFHLRVKGTKGWTYW